MTKDFKRFYVSRAMFLGATMFLASIGMASANPSTDTFGSDEPNPVVASPQQAKHSIKGVVEDALGPIAGANVVEKGTTNGTITDMDGNFSLEVSPNSILVVSYIGYKDQEIPVNNQTSFNIKLAEDSQALDEVVVVGYGTQKKVNLSGSVSTINVAELTESRPITNVSHALAGLAAGVNVQGTANQPGNDNASIKVRGQGTLNESSPLVIIDGVEAGINTVNPQDIESMTVLKDAASSAIYGSRAANGVILITTKQAGTDEKVRVQFQASFGIQSLERKVDVLSPEEWIEFRTAYNNNRYISQYGGKGATIEDDYATRLAMIGGKESYYFLNDPRWTEPGYGNLKLIDWQDEFFRLAPIQNYQLSLSSGRGNTKYRVSMGYKDQEGIAIESNYKRLNFRANRKYSTGLLSELIWHHLPVGMKEDV